MATSSIELWPWMQLALLPNDNSIDQIINVNAYEFILFSSEFSKSYNLYKYNTITNTFNEFITNPDFQCWCPMQIAFDSKQTFYLRHGTSIHSHVIIPNTFNTFKNKTINERNGYFLFVNNHLHIIKNYNIHFICSIENNALKVVSNPTNKHANEHMNGAAIYISSKQLILLIGGYTTTSGRWRSNQYCSKDIWVYSLHTQKWTKIKNISFTRHSFGYTLTSNQRYIILFGGWKYVQHIGHIGHFRISDLQEKKANDIFVLDMNEWKLKKCKIKCPLSGTCYGATTGGIDANNNILVNGFVRKCFKLKEFIQLQLPPTYIVSIIGKYFSAEIIHYIGDENNHYGIYLKHILSSLYE